MEEEVRVMMALGQTSPAFRSVIGTTVGIGSQGIVFDGTPAQKAAVAAQAGHRRADRLASR
jgi:acyl-CoA dehydrogenase